MNTAVPLKIVPPLTYFSNDRDGARAPSRIQLDICLSRGTGF